MKSVEAPEDLHKLFAKALNSGDLDALVALYAFDGLLMTRGGPARGIRAIRSALAEYVEVKPTIQLTTPQGNAAAHRDTTGARGIAEAVAAQKSVNKCRRRGR